MDTLENILKSADVAEYEFDGYYVYVGGAFDPQDGYDVEICKEALPPHESQTCKTLDEVEDYLDGSLGYSKGDSKWIAVDPEQ